MDKKLHKVHDIDKLFYYFSTENETNNIIFRLVLHSKVDKFILKKALNQTIRRFPNFRQTPVVDREGYLYTVDNDREADVYAYDSAEAELGTEAMNGFLFRVMYEGNTIWISLFHSLCDGCGLKMFVRSLLYHYFTLCGFKIPNQGRQFLTEDIPADSTELADPFELCQDGPIVANPYRPDGIENILILPEPNKGVDDCRYPGLFRFVLDTDRLLSLARDAEASVDTYLHLLAARVIHDGYETGDKLISGIGTIDTRPFYRSRGLQNNVALFWLYYGEEFFSLSDKDACRVIEQRFKAEQLRKDIMDGSVLERKTQYKELFGFPITFAQGLRTMRESILTSPEVTSTYFLTNIMRLGLGDEIDALVAGADVYGTPIFNSPVLFVVTQGKKTFINLAQRNLSRYLAQRFRDAFKERGLLISAEMGDSFETDKLRIRNIPVLS